MKILNYNDYTSCITNLEKGIAIKCDQTTIRCPSDRQQLYIIYQDPAEDQHHPQYLPHGKLFPEEKITQYHDQHIAGRFHHRYIGKIQSLICQYRKE